jgi:hypothetical protein
MYTDLASRENFDDESPRHPLNDGESGASIVQLMVAVGLGGILLAIATTLFTNMKKEAAYQERIAGWQQELIIESQKLRWYCEKSGMAGVPVLDSSGYEGRKELRTKIRDFDAFKFMDSGASVLRKGVDKSRELEVTHISLMQESPPIGANPEMVMLSLDVEVAFRAMDATGGLASGAQKSVREFRIPLFARLDAGRKVVSCSYNKEGPDYLCDIMGGSSFDRDSQECLGLQPSIVP